MTRAEEGRLNALEQSERRRWRGTLGSQEARTVGRRSAGWRRRRRCASRPRRIAAAQPGQAAPGDAGRRRWAAGRRSRIAVGAVLLWLATGFYTVRPDEVGLNLVFGRYTGTTQPGLNYNFPYPIGSVVQAARHRGQHDRGRLPQQRSALAAPASRDVLEESLMLTGDENIVDIDFAVQWQINPAKAADFVFNIQSPEASVKAVAESAHARSDRPSQHPADPDHRPRRDRGRGAAGDAGHAESLRRRRRNPPCAVAEGRSAAQVIDAFRDVQAARQDQDRARNEAETYKPARSCPRREARPPASCRKRKPIASASSPRRTARRAASSRSMRNTARLPT